MALTKRPRSTRATSAVDIDALLLRIPAMNGDELRTLWRQRRGQAPPAGLTKDLIARALAYWLQEARDGGLDPLVRKRLAATAKGAPPSRHLGIGTRIVREHRGQLHEVTVVPNGFMWNGQTYASLSLVAKTITGTAWNGYRFFGLRNGAQAKAIGSEPAKPSPRAKGNQNALAGAAAISTAKAGWSHVLDSPPIVPATHHLPPVVGEVVP